MQIGSGNCSLCGSPGVTMVTCPLNPNAKNPSPKLHPLAKLPNKTETEKKTESKRSQKDLHKELMKAVREGKTESVRWLLETGRAQPELQDREGKNALMWASYYGHTEIVELLLAAGRAHLELQDNFGDTALMLASFNGHTEIVKLLLATGSAHPELQNIYGKNALIQASRYGREEIVKLLLETGNSRPELQDRDGNTALMWASRSVRVEIVKLLLETDQSRPLLKNNQGLNALDYANDEIRSIISQHLEKQKAIVRSKTRRGIISKTKSERKKLEPLPILDPLKLCRLPSSPENKQELEGWYKLFEPDPKEGLSFRELCAALALLHKSYGRRDWATLALCQRPLSEWSPDRFIWMVSYVHKLGVKPHLLVDRFPGGPQELAEKKGVEFLEKMMPGILNYYCKGLRHKLIKKLKK